jgi:5-methyltetrahydrofolate--homocysteine methyltransferase
MSNPLSRLLEERGRLVADGGMGTSLFELGLETGSTPELWNVEHPDRVAKVHLGFIEAGADVILTNTFGGTSARLGLDRLEHRVAELNEAGVRLAREVAEDVDREVVVVGSVGPTGQLFEPLGELTHEQAVAMFAEQMKALASAGADLLWIETLSSIEELAAAVEAGAGTGLAMVTTMSFDTHGKTMMGVPPSALASWWQSQDLRPAAVGANCGIGPADVVAAAAGIKSADPSLVTVAKGNCGIPKVIDGKLWYPTSSDDMFAYAELALDAGATIIGACCGSVPDHIAQIRAVVDTHEPAEFSFEAVEARLGPVSPPESSARRESRSRRGRVRVD